MVTPRHYLWAGLDFLIEGDQRPVLIEANRSSHMLGEYSQFLGNDQPFALTAGVMNRAEGPPCLLWRRGEPFPDADEDACFIASRLRPHLAQEPVVCDVEDNQEPREELISRDGRRIRPGSIFRWWYPLPWSYERAGVTVINPNCVWVAVRDKLASYETLAAARTFRVPRAFAVESTDAARRVLAEHPQVFRAGYVVKPRVGWGGAGVQIGDPGDLPREVLPGSLLSERIWSRAADGTFFEVRVFVMAGEYLGGIRHTSRSPQTNYWRGGRAALLDRAIEELLEPAALEAVRLLDDRAEEFHRCPDPPVTELTRVVY